MCLFETHYEVLDSKVTPGVTHSVQCGIVSLRIACCNSRKPHFKHVFSNTHFPRFFTDSIFDQPRILGEPAVLINPECCACGLHVLKVTRTDFLTLLVSYSQRSQYPE